MTKPIWLEREFSSTDELKKALDDAYSEACTALGDFVGRHASSQEEADELSRLYNRCVDTLYWTAFHRGWQEGRRQR